MRPSSLLRLVAPVLRTAVMCASASAGSALAASDLQLSYDVGPKSTQPSAVLVARVSADVDFPLKLEYELKVRVEHMTQTTRELRSIIEAMPGPTLPVDNSLPPPVKFSSPLQETISRLNHVDQLVADIARIIETMPVSGKAAHPVKPASEAIEQKPSPPPLPTPTPTPDRPLPPSTIRALWLGLGGIVAALLARHLRKLYLRRRPSVKELAATIDAPPIRDEALELADVMSSMGMADGAAEALVQSIQANPRQSLTHWLKLLDVYRKTGQRDQFEKAATDMRMAFNVEAGRWDGTQKGSESEKSLEDYPHIVTQLKKLWSSAECAEYLLSLLADNREGKRDGFPLQVVEEIVLLLAILRPD